MKKAETKSNIVLVGTYRPENESWIRERRLYNLPLPVFVSRKDGRAGAPRTPPAALPFHQNISAIVLFAEGHPNFAFKAKFKEVVDGSWLKTNGYSLSAKPHGEMYALYELLEESTPAKILGRKSAEVFVSSSRCPVVKIDESFYSKPYPVTGGKSMPYVFDCLKPYFKKWKLATTFNPVQEDFFAILDGNKMKTLRMKDSVVGCDEYSMIDLFAGAGGLSEGLEEAGFHSVFASEIVPQYADTYRRNHPNANVVTEDIRKLDAEDIRKKLGIEKGQLALIAGGPPCQGFSINAPIRSVLDKRNHLFKEYLRFVDAFQPRAVLIENVPGLVSFEDGDTLHAILKALGELGYGADVRILGAAYYGVPQMRWRTIILGFRGIEMPRDAFPEPVCHAPIRPNFTATFDGHSLIKTPAVGIPGNFVTVEDAIGDLPPLKAGERGHDCKEYLFKPKCDFQRAVRRGSPGVYNHEAPRLSPVNLQRLKYIKPGGNWTAIPHDLLPKGMKKARKSDHTKRYGRLTPDGLASTILTKCDPHWGAYFHYEQDRSLTVREAARCQSFPDHYIFYGSQQEQFAQVGNAVPPMLAKAVGVSIKAVLDEEDR